MADYRWENLELVGRIEVALARIKGVNFSVGVRRLLGVMGYESERVWEGRSGGFERGIAWLGKPETSGERELLRHASFVGLVFQFAEEEMRGGGGERLSEESLHRSFLFLAVALKKASYSRRQYALFVRVLNRRFGIPAVVLFLDQDELFTLAFVYRRPNKREPKRDVLGRVFLIREINPRNPHRAPLDILASLSLDARLRWMSDNRKPRNFDGLLDAWLAALDAQELNKRFYRELLAWFERACEQARFPKVGARTFRPQEHVIRLITRLLFIWFLKEKSLVASELFVEQQVASLLKDYDRDSGDSYYRAILQNLFFANLNTEIDRRGFSKGSNATHRDFSRYRYEKEIATPAQLLALFAQTPFINGGLFDRYKFTSRRTRPSSRTSPARQSL